MSPRFFFYIVVSLLAVACHISKTKPTQTINGSWESIGSGWLLEISDSTTYQFYDLTSISCVTRRKGQLEELQASLSLKKDTLSLKKGVITYQFTRMTTLPEVCSAEVPVSKQKDAIYNFEVFAETVQTHYAFFELNAIDWNRLYATQKATLIQNPTDVTLHQVINETLEALNDNHAFLEVPDDVYTAVENTAAAEETIETSEILPEYGDFQVAKMVAKHHLQEELTEDSWLLQWGKLTDSIGYIQVKAMWLFADLEISKERIDEIGYVDAYIETFHQMYEGDYIQKEVAGVAKIMDRVMNDLSNMKSIVIDIRFNGGGQDAVAFEILSRFIPKKLKVATQKLRYRDSFSPILPLYIKGTKQAFTKPVYIVTSPQTGSAAEAFSIATMAIQHVYRIGSHTQGAMSTALEKTLPNGWTFAISNEIYMDIKGNSYENTGVPVDYELNYLEDRQPFFRSVVNDLKADKQAILQAIGVLEKK